VHKAHGRPSIATIRDFLPCADADMANEEVERREMEDLDGVVALPGARELLNAIPSHRWAIVTSGTRPLAELRLRAAGLPIPARLVTADDITRGKPDPEPYLKGSLLLRFPAQDCIVLEDAPAGIRAGKAAAARVIAVRNTFASSELTEAGADWIVNNCASISVLSQISGQKGLTINIGDD